MSLVDTVTEKIAVIVSEKMADESKARVAALFCVRSAMPEADAVDRILLARFIITGRENIPEDSYPYNSGDITVLGPGIFASTDGPAADTVINWEGRNFVPQAEPEPAPSKGEKWTGHSPG